MKKNLIYGVIAAVIALILLIGAVMSRPDPQNDPAISTDPAENTAPSATVTTAPEPTDETALPTQPEETGLIVPPQTQPTEPATEVTEPTTRQTEPASQPTEAATQPTENESSVLAFVAWPETISGGETGTVTIRGKPNTTYSIKVYYKSGPSSAKGLEDKVSDADGMVTWSWKVSKNAKPGDFKIVVTGGGETKEVPFSVLD